MRRELPYLVGGLDAEHDVEAEAAADDGAGHDPHVRPPSRSGRRHCSYANAVYARRGGWGARLDGDGVSRAEEGEGEGIRRTATWEAAEAVEVYCVATADGGDW